MGWSDRIGNIVGGIFGAGKAVIGLTADLATGNWNDDDDFDGFADGFGDMLVQRAATFGTELFGVREDGPGRGLAGVPGVTGALEGLETVGREAIREPLTALVTASTGEAQESFGGFADIPVVGGVLGGAAAVVSGKVSMADIRRAHDIAQSRSIGQALVIGLAGKNPWDDRDVAELMNTGWWTVSTGTVDGVFRFFADVDVLTGKALAAGRMRHLVRPLGQDPSRLGRALGYTGDIQKNIDAFFTGEGVSRGATRARWQDVNRFIEESVGSAGSRAEASGHVRRRLFDKTDPYGDFKASLLVNAPDATTRAQVMRFLMGDLKQLERVEDYYRGLKEGVEEASDLQVQYGASLAGMRELAISEALTMHHTDSWVADLSKFIVRNDDHLTDTLDDQIRFATQELNFVENLQGMFKSQVTEVRPTRMGDLKDSFVSSKVYQSPLGKPVRVFTEMRPHKYVNLNQKGVAEEQLARMMVDARLGLNDVEKWRGKMAEAQTPGQRFEVWLEAEQAALHKIVDDLGIGKLSLADARRIAAHARQGHAAARNVLNGQRAFAPGEAGVMKWADESGEIHVHARPLARTQLVDGLATTDFRAIRQALFRYQKEGLLPTASRVGSEKLRLPTEVLNGLSYYWKASQLLRPGWTTRVVLMDEQLRRFAKFGAAMSLMQTGKQLRGVRNAFIKELRLDEAAGVAQFGRTLGGVTGAAAGIATGGAAPAILGYVGGRFVGGIAGQTAGGKVASVMKGLKDAGYQINIGGRTFDPFDAEGIYKDQLGQSRDISTFLEPETARLYEQMSGQWGTVRGTDANHRQAWVRVMSRQVAQDPLWRQALDPNGSPEKMLAWLKTTEGRQYLNDIPWRSGEPTQLHQAGRWVDADPEQWVQTMYDLGRELVRHDDDLAESLFAAATAKGASDDTLAAVANELYDRMSAKATNASELPDVHGELLAQISGKSQVLKTIDQTIQKGFKYLGGLPTDTLSRQPTFALFFEERMKHLLKGIPDERITEPMLRRFEKQSREHALAQTRKLMYDLAERSQFDDLARFIVPFAPAGREVLSRWMGLIAENPAVLARARQAWQAPNQIDGLIETDDEGNEYLAFRVPEFAAGLLNHTPFFSRALDSQGRVKFSKDAFATVPLFGDNAAEAAMQGLFGFGPFVQVAVGKLVEERPDLEDAMSLITPYGIPKDTADAFLPAYAKRARSAGMIPGMNSGGLDERLEDRAYASMFFNIMKTHITEMNLGERDRINFDDEVERAGFIASVKREADDLARLRLFATYLLPAAPMFESPFAPLVEEYQRLKDNEQFINEQRAAAGKAPVTAEQVFYQIHGREYASLIQSTSRNNTGIPATGAGFTVSTKHKDMLTKYPELGGLIVGLEGGGTLTKFSAAMYQHQLKNETFEGSGEKQRERLSPDEFLTESDVSAGWDKYRRIMDLIEAERQRRGLPNLQVKAAGDLADMKRRAIAVISQKHPGWAEARSTFDRGVWQRKIEGMAAIVSDRQLSQRPDTQLLKKYLQVREQMLAQLAARRASGGAASLTASSNQDLAALWETVVNRMMAQSPMFVDLYYRWLEGDPLTLDTSMSRKAA